MWFVPGDGRAGLLSGEEELCEDSGGIAGDKGEPEGWEAHTGSSLEMTGSGVAGRGGWGGQV